MVAVLVAIVLLSASIGLSLKKPFWSVVGLAALIPFDRGFELAGITVHTNELYLFGLGLGFIWYLKENPELLPEVWKYVWPAIPFLIAISLSMWNAEYKMDVVKQFFRWSEFFLVFIIVKFRISNRKEFYWLLGTIFVFGILSSFLGMAQNLLSMNIVSDGTHLDTMSNIDNVIRAYATFGHPNQFAGYLVLLVPLAFELFLENENLKYQLLMGMVTIVLGLALSLTYSRGGWVSTLLGVCIILIYYIPRNIVKSSILFIVFIILVMLLPSYLVQLNQRVAGLVNIKKDTAVSGRLFYQKVAFKMVKEHPVVGHGAGNYRVVIDKYKPVVRGDYIYLDKHIHNLYSQIAIETGLLGLLGFLFFIIMYLKRLVSGFRRTRTIKDKAMILAIGASVSAFLFHNNFDVLMIYARGIHLGVVMSLGLAFVTMSRKKMMFQESVNHVEVH